MVTILLVTLEIQERVLIQSILGYLAFGIANYDLKKINIGSFPYVVKNSTVHFLAVEFLFGTLLIWRKFLYPFQVKIELLLIHFYYLHKNIKMQNYGHPIRDPCLQAKILNKK